MIRPDKSSKSKRHNRSLDDQDGIRSISIQTDNIKMVNQFTNMQAEIMPFLRDLIGHVASPPGHSLGSSTLRNTVIKLLLIDFRKIKIINKLFRYTVDHH